MANGDEWRPDSQLNADSPHFFKPGMTPAEYVAAEAAAVIPTIRAVANCLLANDLDRARSCLSDAMPHMRPNRLIQGEQGKHFGPPPDGVNGALNRICNVLVRDVTRKRLWFDWVERIQAIVRSATAGLVEVYCRAREASDANATAASSRKLGALSNEDLAKRLNSDADALGEFASQHAGSAAATGGTSGDESTGGGPGAHEEGDSQPDRFAELREWTVATLRKAERATLELLTAEPTNATSLANLALKLDWQGHGPHDDQAGSLRRRINKKLRDGRQPWKIVRHDNEFRLQSAEPGSPRSNTTKRRRASKKKS